MKIKAKCLSDQLLFSCQVKPFDLKGRTMLTAVCPNCRRRYISTDGGKTFHADRPLKVVARIEE